MSEESFNSKGIDLPNGSYGRSWTEFTEDKLKLEVEGQGSWLKSFELLKFELFPIGNGSTLRLLIAPKLLDDDPPDDIAESDEVFDASIALKFVFKKLLLLFINGAVVKGVNDKEGFKFWKKNESLNGLKSFFSLIELELNKFFDVFDSFILILSLPIIVENNGRWIDCSWTEAWHCVIFGDIKSELIPIFEIKKLLFALCCKISEEWLNKIFWLSWQVHLHLQFLLKPINDSI